ncbi:DUF1223 domain-containing protein [Paraflavitalea pollutisoli]|uniref:DUF1223 domain-containing protein n=1 Tax=Paraflavitalea pollutisoli TaxID=3034143 RepID=UPI0023ED54A5|nr:DUF1223 domain-containing protein [Paraflavitalea sp. H1-2-19X]
MKYVKLVAIGASLVLTLAAGVVVARNAEIAEPAPAVSDSGFAVLELFTSEGCSSCPPADALLERIAKESAGKPVYVLAYHVDYWDRQGWKDIFSDHRYSERQYAYGQHLGAQVYTPQLVVNGNAEMVGSDESAVKAEVAKALSRPAIANLQATGHVDGSKLAVSYEVTGKTQRSRLLIAFVQKHAISKVERGENAGRTLPHAQIVRDFRTYDLKSAATGQVMISLPAGFNTTEWEVIGLVQQAGAGDATAASRIAIG